MKKKINYKDEEPDQKSFDIPSEKEHLFQVVDIYDFDNNEYNLNIDPDTVVVKLEVCGGDEEGRSLLHRMSIDPEWKGFFATQLFLKAIGEPYKGKFEIDTEEWVGKQFFATIKHNEYNNKMYANIDQFNFEKQVEKSTEEWPD